MRCAVPIDWLVTDQIPVVSYPSLLFGADVPVIVTW